jgi:hypothetical protein
MLWYLELRLELAPAHQQWWSPLELSLQQSVSRRPAALHRRAGVL